MSLAPRFHVLIPAAGVGARAGGERPKQYQCVAGKPLIAHTLASFRALSGRFQTLAIVVAPDDVWVNQVLPEFPAPPANGIACAERLVRLGGATRAQTVQAGLADLLARGADPLDWVLVHDAARCLVTPGQIESLIDACQDDEVGGLLAVPLADTLKEADADSHVRRTLSRSDKWLAQTPQMFRLAQLQHALAHADAAGVPVTDEASALEALGLAPRLVAANAQNFKITYPDDFALAEAVLWARRSQATK